MRQAGIIAAGALYAVENHISRLAVDHANIRRLAEALSQIEGVSVDLETVQTNILYFSIAKKLGTAEHIVTRFRQQGILMMSLSPQDIRAVTHLDVSREDIEHVVEVLPKIFS